MTDLEPLVEAIWKRAVLDDDAMALLAHVGAEAMAALLPDAEEMTVREATRLAEGFHDALLGAMLTGIMVAVGSSHGLSFRDISIQLGEAVARQLSPRRARGIRVAGGDG